MIHRSTSTIARSLPSRESALDIVLSGERFDQPALCAQADPEGFHPEKGGSSTAAKKICGRCELRERCLQLALDNDERWGIWGGTTPRDRARIKKAQAAAS